MENENLQNLTPAEDITDSASLSDVWDAIDTKVYHVVDEEGVNFASAQIRRLTAKLFIYVDDRDGYEILPNLDAERLLLVDATKHVPYGWDAQGNVVAL